MKTYIIGEIGINHNGDMDVIKKLIDIAVCAGFDAVKFQKRNPNKCVPEHQKNVLRQTPWGEMTYLEYKKKIELTRDQYAVIDLHCMRAGIDWSASPWDLDSAKFLVGYDLPWVKIASASITDLELVEYCARNFDHVIVSTGMSTNEQVKQAIETLRSHLNDQQITVLHCNSSYPAPVSELNLNCINTLKKNYPEMRIGYSGHEYGIVTTMATVAMGSRCIERHITLDKGMWGSDQSCSLEPHAMFKLVRGIRELELAMGGYGKTITKSEQQKLHTLKTK